jgi:hypothetical protein
MTKPPLTIRLDPTTRAALEGVAAKEERSLSFLLERIMREWLKRHGYLREKSE